MTAAFTLRRTLRGFKPLHCDGDGLYLVRRDMVVRADLDLGTLRPVARLPGRHWSRRVPSRLLQRVFRTEPQSAARLADGSLLVVYDSPSPERLQDGAVLADVVRLG